VIRRRLAVAAVAAGTIGTLFVTSAPAQAAHLRTVPLTGAAEAPNPGDPDGSGLARIALYPDEGRICYVIEVDDVALPVRAAHIHEAPPGQAGPVVVALEAPTKGRSRACQDVDPALVQDLFDNSADYYVNVHNAQFPGGAVRGQLGSPPAAA